MIKYLTYLILCLGTVAIENESSQDQISPDIENFRTFKGYLGNPRSSQENTKATARRVDQVTQEELEQSFKNCRSTLKEIKDLELRLIKKGRVVRQRKADVSILRAKNLDPIVYGRERSQLPFEIVSCDIQQKYNLSKDEVANDLPKISLNGDTANAFRDECLNAQMNPQCDRYSMYRTADGRCNNLNNPTWGMSTACQQRLMSAYYTGNSQYRRSVNGNALPRPRTLSLNLHNHMNRPTNYVNHLYMFFGQLLDHDIALTPPSVTEDNEAIECCPPADETHPQCDPILLSSEDRFYSQFGISCLNFVRSAICSTCTLGQREQMNQVTSYIDASFVYGNNENETRSLRTNDGTGRLLFQQSNFGTLLPRSNNPNEDQCSFPETNDICFRGGDPRVNQHTVLASLHTIFMREHNRIVTELRQINPQWNGDTLFQEARRILGAEMQAIVYKEYLPITLGSDRMRYFNLWLLNRGTTKYDPEKDATMHIEFTTAAFRFGHSLIHSVVSNSPLNATNGERLLRNEFFQPFDLYNGIMGPLMRGTSRSPAQWFDRHLVQDVTNFLYRVRGNSTGLDLAAININRGRDHGVPPYVEMVRYCSENRIVVGNFDDLVRNNLMRNEQARVLEENYRFVEDIDLWPGILMEIPNDGAVVGPTAACIIGLQFNHLKYGDRFYFEHGYQKGSFTYQQLQELRKVTLSYIICLNENIAYLPLNAMLFSSRDNPMINCRYVNGINLSYWKE